MEAAISPRLLLAEHRWPSGAQEGGRADEEQQYDEEGVEVEQRRLPSGRGRPQHHDGRGVVVLVLTMPARAARARQEKRTNFSRGLHVLLSMWWWVGRRFYISNSTLQHLSPNAPCWAESCQLGALWLLASAAHENAFPSHGTSLNGKSERGRCAATAAALCSSPPPAAAGTTDRPGHCAVTLWRAEVARAVEAGQEPAAQE